MTGATQRPWGYVHHKGLDKHLVGAVLENVAIVEDSHGNAKENAEFIVKAVNNHDALVAALEAVVEASNNAVRAGQAIGRSYTTPPVIQLVEAALKAVK